MDSVIAIRTFSLLVIAFSSMVIYSVKLKLGCNKRIATWAGVFYPMLIFFISPNYEINTEIFFNLFTLLGFYFLVLSNKTFHIFLSGLALGIGFMVKYVTAFDTFIMYVFFILGLFHGNTFKHKFLNFKKSSIAFLAFLIPFALVNIYYFKIDAYSIFYNSTFKASKVYTSEITLEKEIMFIGNLLKTYFPVFVLFFINLVYKINKRGRNMLFGIFSLFWLVFTLVPMILQGKHYGHYYVQAAVPLSLLSAEGFTLIRNQWLKKLLIATFFLYVFNSFYNEYRVVKTSNNSVEKIVEFLTPKLKAEDDIYTNIQPLYYYLGKLPPTKIVHQSVILTHSHAKAAGINRLHELDLIFESKPVYVILYKSMGSPYLLNKLKDYEIIDIYDKEIRVFKRK